MKTVLLLIAHSCGYEPPEREIVIGSMSGQNLMEDMGLLAGLDPTKDADLSNMAAKTAWNSCVLSQIEHTPYLLRMLTFKTDFIKENAGTFSAHIKPAVAAIQAAYTLADPTARTAM